MRSIHYDFIYSAEYGWSFWYWLFLETGIRIHHSFTIDVTEIPLLAGFMVGLDAQIKEAQA